MKHVVPLAVYLATTVVLPVLNDWHILLQRDAREHLVTVTIVATVVAALLSWVERIVAQRKVRRRR